MVWFDIDVDGTRLGRVEFELYSDMLPRTCENFEALAERKAFKRFDQVVRNFVVECSGGEDVLFEDKLSSYEHDAPYLLSTEKASSRFIVTLRAAPHLDGKNAVFGKVTSGFEAVDAVARVPVDRNHKPLQEVVVAASGCREEEEEEEDEEYVSEEEAPSEGMTEREKRMLKVRMLMNKGRKANAAAAKEERSRKKAERAKGVGAMERAEERKAAKEKWLEGLEKRGISKDKAYMFETADSAERRHDKQRKKNERKAAFGWDVFNSDTLHKAYQKRVGDLPPSSTKEDDEEGEDDPTTYGHQDGPQDEEALDRMVAELEKGDKRKAAFSRRRAHVQEADVDYINDRNKVFNKKIKRAFDKYTVEIRQNLERGTAV